MEHEYIIDSVTDRAMDLICAIRDARLNDEGVKAVLDFIHKMIKKEV